MHTATATTLDKYECLMQQADVLFHRMARLGGDHSSTPDVIHRDQLTMVRAGDDVIFEHIDSDSNLEITLTEWQAWLKLKHDENGECCRHSDASHSLLLC